MKSKLLRFVSSKSSEAGESSPEVILQGKEHKEERLDAWHATAICGNDITSSCLYVSSIVIVYAGVLAPVALLLAAGVLYLYKKIYTEVVEALPLDGGVYNCLLNCTRKFDASIAACLTILSYLATAVISAKTSAEYLKDLLPVMPPMEITALILVAFAGLSIMGISDSATSSPGDFRASYGYADCVCPVDAGRLKPYFHVGDKPANLVAAKELGEILVLGVFGGHARSEWF